MSLKSRCATIGCPCHASRDHAHCNACRHLRKRAKRSGVDPDARDWRYLSARFGERDTGGSHAQL